MEALINLTAILIISCVISCVIGKIAERIVINNNREAKRTEEETLWREGNSGGVYIINVELKEDFIAYFSLFKEGSLYEDQCYGMRFSFSVWGSDTHTPEEFLESWLTDPTF